MRDVVAGAGDLHQPEVALDHHHLGGGRDAGKAEPGRGLAFGHMAARGEARLLWMLHDERVEGSGVGEGPAEHHGVGDRRVGIGEGDGASGAEQADLGDLPAFEAAGRGGVGPDVDADLAGAPGHELHQRHVVDGGLGVGERHHGGDAARRRGGGAALHGLLVLAAGLAELDPHIHQARRQAVAVALDDGGTRGVGGGTRAHRRDLAVGDQQVAFLVERRRGIEEARVLEERARGHWIISPAARFRARGSAPRGTPCARPRPSPPGVGSGCGRCRRRPRCRSRRRGSSGPGA